MTYTFEDVIELAEELNITLYEAEAILDGEWKDED